MITWFWPISREIYKYVTSFPNAHEGNWNNSFGFYHWKNIAQSQLKPGNSTNYKNNSESIVEYCGNIKLNFTIYLAIMIKLLLLNSLPMSMHTDEWFAHFHDRNICTKFQMSPMRIPNTITSDPQCKYCKPVVTIELVWIASQTHHFSSPFIAISEWIIANSDKFIFQFGSWLIWTRFHLIMTWIFSHYIAKTTNTNWIASTNCDCCQLDMSISESE